MDGDIVSKGNSGRGRPKVSEIEMTTENKTAVLNYIKQGMTDQEIATEMRAPVAQIRLIYNQYIKDAEAYMELDRVGKMVDDIIENTIKPRNDRISKMHEMLNNTVDALYARYKEDEDGLDSGDFAMILKLLERDEQTVMAAGRLHSVKSKASDTNHHINRDKIIKLDEMRKKYDDLSEEDVLLVEDVIREIEDG